MSNLSDYEIEQIGVKLKANINSKTLKNNPLKLEELDPETKKLDEYISQLQKGLLKVNIPEFEDEENFVETDAIVIDEQGEELLVKLLEPQLVAQKRKEEAYTQEAEEEVLTPEEIEEKDSKKENLEKYTVISLEDEDGNPFDLVLDENGCDIGKIKYDEDGKPEFEMSEDLKSNIEDKINKSNVRNFVKEETIQDEFFIQDIDALVRAIEEDILVPEDSEVGKRAIIANAINENRDFNELEDKYIQDGIKTVSKTEREKELERKIAEIVEKKLEEDEKENGKTDVRERERDLVQDQQNKEDDEKEEVEKQDLDTEPKLDKTNPEEKENDEDEEEKDDVIELPDDIKEEVEEYAENNDIDMSAIKDYLIIEDANSVADATENSNITRNGNEVIVLQFSGIAGNPKYRQIQDGNETGGDEHDEAYRKRIDCLHMTTGRVKRVEDHETTYTVYDSRTGKTEEKEFDANITDNKKEEFNRKIAEFMERLEEARENAGMVKEQCKNDPEKMAELLGKINENINSIQLQMYKEFEGIGEKAPDVIKEQAATTEPEDKKEILEGNQDNKYTDDDFFDEIGRLTGPTRPR